MAAVARPNTTVAGREELFWVTKPGDTTPTPMGCLTTFTDNVPGRAAEQTACRDGVVNAPAGDETLGTIPVTGITRRFPTAQQATKVTGDMVRQWASETTILTIQWGGTYIGDPIYTASGWFSDYSSESPQTGNKTWSATFNKIAKETSATVAAS
jgi:hypothetical protein